MLCDPPNPLKSSTTDQLFKTRVRSQLQAHFLSKQNELTLAVFISLFAQNNTKYDDLIGRRNRKQSFAINES